MLSCGSNGGNKESGQNITTDAAIVPDIDTADLKDEASILEAMQKVVDARIADDKKKKEDPSYKGYYLELTRLYTTVLRASTAYAKTIADPNTALDFHSKVNEIRKKTD